MKYIFALVSLLAAPAIVAAETRPPTVGELPVPVATATTTLETATGGDSERLLAELEADAKANPSDARKLAKYGLALVRAGRNEDGLAALTRARSMSPDEPEVLLLHAKGLAKTGHVAEAIEFSMKAARSPLATPKLAAEALFTAGSLEWRRNDLDEAEKLLKEAITRDRHSAGAYMNLGLLYLDQEKLSDGMAMLEQAALVGQDNPGVLKSLARTFEARGMLDKAFERWKRLVELAPEDPGIHFVFGSYCFEKQMWSLAEKSFQKCVAINAADSSARLKLAQTLQRTGRYDEAEKQALLAQKIGHPEAQSVLESIAFERKLKPALAADRSPKN